MTHPHCAQCVFSMAGGTHLLWLRMRHIWSLITADIMTSVSDCMLCSTVLNAGPSWLARAMVHCNLNWFSRMCHVIMLQASIQKMQCSE